MIEASTATQYCVGVKPTLRRPSIAVKPTVQLHCLPKVGYATLISRIAVKVAHEGKISSVKNGVGER